MTKRTSTKEYYDFLGFSMAANAELEEDCDDIIKEIYFDLMGVRGIMGEMGERDGMGARGAKGVKGERGEMGTPQTPSGFRPPIFFPPFQPLKPLLPVNPFQPLSPFPKSKNFPSTPLTRFFRRLSNSSFAPRNSIIF